MAKQQSPLTGDLSCGRLGHVLERGGHALPHIGAETAVLGPALTQTVPSLTILSVSRIALGSAWKFLTVQPMAATVVEDAATIVGSSPIWLLTISIWPLK
jgi:hypothetical protein